MDERHIENPHPEALMKVANPYLNFPGNTEEAFNFYRSVFGGEFTNVTRFRDMGGEAMGVPEKDLDGIANIGLPIGNNNVLMATDAVESFGMELKQGNNFYIALETDTADEAKKVFAALSDGGNIEMELQKTEWAEMYGSLVDQFDVHWMVMYTGDVKFG
jgi:PhnB protein